MYVKDFLNAKCCVFIGQMYENISYLECLFTAVMKPVQDSLICITMQEAFGCAVENRFLQLQDDDCDPLDLLHQASIEVTKRKKKESPATKKSGNQQEKKKESQKERKIQVAPITAAPGMLTAINETSCY